MAKHALLSLAWVVIATAVSAGIVPSQSGSTSPKMPKRPTLPKMPQLPKFPKMSSKYPFAHMPKRSHPHRGARRPGLRRLDQPAGTGDDYFPPPPQVPAVWEHQQPEDEASRRPPPRRMSEPLKMPQLPKFPKMSSKVPFAHLPKRSHPPRRLSSAPSKVRARSGSTSPKMPKTPTLPKMPRLPKLPKMSSKVPFVHMPKWSHPPRGARRPGLRRLDQPAGTGDDYFPPPSKGRARSGSASPKMPKTPTLPKMPRLPKLPKMSSKVPFGHIPKWSHPPRGARRPGLRRLDQPAGTGTDYFPPPTQDPAVWERQQPEDERSRRPPPRRMSVPQLLPKMPKFSRFTKSPFAKLSSHMPTEK